VQVTVLTSRYKCLLMVFLFAFSLQVFSGRASAQVDSQVGSTQGAQSTVRPFVNSASLRDRVYGIIGAKKPAHTTKKVKKTALEYSVVQMAEPIQPSDRLNLESLGAKIMGYISSTTLLILAHPYVSQAVAISSPAVKSVKAFTPDQKIAPELRLALSGLHPAGRNSGASKMKVLLHSFPGSEKALLAELRHIKKLTVSRALSLTNEKSPFAMEVSSQDVVRMSALKSVQWVDLNPPTSVVPDESSGVGSLRLDSKPDPAQVAAAEVVASPLGREVRTALNGMRPKKPASNNIIEAVAKHVGQAKLADSGLARWLLIDDETGVAQGEERVYPIRVENSSRLKATLVYTDAKKLHTSDTTLVNDLEIVLLDKSGNEVLASDQGRRVEQIDTELSAGDYEVRVKGLRVPLGSTARNQQPFSLVISAN
jgi:hypothetical protein